MPLLFVENPLSPIIAAPVYGYGAICSGNPPEFTSAKKNDFLSLSNQQPIAPQLGMGFGEPLLPTVLFWLFLSCAVHHIWDIFRIIVMYIFASFSK